METSFEALREELNSKVKPENPCSSEYRRFLKSENEEQLLKVIYDNLNWCLDHKVLSHDYFSKFNQEVYLKSGIANTGLENTGFSNSGDSNSGNRNSGNSNSGSWNSGNWNSGNRNSGYRNSGNRNSGSWNSGSWNSGNCNSGNSNSGDSNSGNSNSGSWNSGDSNSGNRNSGDSNSGNRNSGYSNSGNSNSGNRNSGNWNSGNRNSGDSNSGYRNSGAFCTDKNPTLFLFNKPTKILIKDWENSKAVEIMYNIDTTLWIPFSSMTEEEKASNPNAETTHGYLKTIPIKEAWKNAWHNFTDENKKVFLSLPNFDPTIFEEITGIKVD